MSVTNPICAPRDGDPDWLAALRTLARDTSIAEAARRIGMARASVSLVLAGKYPAQTGKVEALVRAKLIGLVACPAMGESIAIDRCRDISSRPFSAASGRAARQYRACQACPHRPEKADAQ